MKYEVLTPNGWSDFSGVRKLYRKNLYKVTTLYELLVCTDDHKLKTISGIFKSVCDLNIGDLLYLGNSITDKVLLQPDLTLVYDLIQVEKNNLYYTNGLISHNCGHIFHKLWVLALLGLNPFNTIKLPWDRHPLRDQLWRDKQTKAVGLKLAARLYDCSFASSGDTVLNDTLLNTLLQLFCLNPILMHCNLKLWIWKHPLLGKNYIISADVARGDGGDYSAFHIICVLDDLQVGLYKGKINTKDYGQLLVLWATKYNMALLIVLNANIGWAVLQLIIDLLYKNLYYHKKDFKYVDTLLHSKMKRTKSSDLQKDILGFSTTSKTRPLIILKTMLLLLTKLFIIRSKRLINLLRTFIWINGRALAMGSYNDDLTMSLCIGVWVRNTSYMLKKQASALTRQKLANINSGLNLRGLALKKVTSGFYSGANTSDKNVISIGGLNINIADFYFKK